VQKEGYQHQERLEEASVGLLVVVVDHLEANLTLQTSVDDSSSS